MESVKLRPRDHRWRIVAEDDFRGSRSVHDNHGNVAQLDLIDWAIFEGPDPIQFSSVGLANLPKVVNYRTSRWSAEVGYPRYLSDEFVPNEAGD